jgi:hypothetical protein
MFFQPQNVYQIFLDHLVELLDITPSQFEKAKERYNAVGTWLSKEDSPLNIYNPEIYLQGSFRLGTVIKPISGEDEFDIDLLCKLKLSKSQVSQKQLKKMVGDRLKENGDYCRMLRDEGQRCWTLDYQEAPKFHMDILPAINDAYQWLLENRVSLDYAKNAICITDTNSGEYSLLSDNWQKSNPIGYSDWFRDQMKIQFLQKRMLLAESRKSSIESVKEEEVKTPLQRAVQILKRHRDIMFGNDEDRPISIIITTLAARAYSEEDNLYLALRNILDRMPDFIRVINGVSTVENPVNPFENFADKWQLYPQRKDNFIAWMKKAKEDIFELVEKIGFERSIENLREVFGKRFVNESLNKSGLRYLNENTNSSIPIQTSFLAVPYKEIPNWPLSLTKEASINARYKDGKEWHTITKNTTIPKNKDLLFTARTNVEKPFTVYWQVVNTGEEAKNSNCLRGEIFPAKTAGVGGLRHKEATQYTGTHWVECFIIKEGICVARSNEIFVKIS